MGEFFLRVAKGLMPRMFWLSLCRMAPQEDSGWLELGQSSPDAAIFSERAEGSG